MGGNEKREIGEWYEEGDSNVRRTRKGGERESGGGGVIQRLTRVENEEGWQSLEC